MKREKLLKHVQSLPLGTDVYLAGADGEPLDITESSIDKVGLERYVAVFGTDKTAVGMAAEQLREAGDAEIAAAKEAAAQRAAESNLDYVVPLEPEEEDFTYDDFAGAGE